jgi:hypothetical protein
MHCDQDVRESVARCVNSNPPLTTPRVRTEADCTIAETFVLMRERAAASETTLAEIVAAVMNRSICFERPDSRRVAEPGAASGE